MKNTARARNGHLLAFAGAFCLTPDGVLVRLAGVDGWNVIFWRGLIIAVALFLALAVKHRSRFFQHLMPSNRLAWLVAALFAVSSVMFVLGVIHSSIASVLVTLSVMPLFSAFYGHLFMGETTSRRTWLVMGAAVVGIGVVFSGDLGSGGWLGNLFALACACLTAAHISMIRSAQGTVNVTSVYGWGGVLLAAACFWATPPMMISLESMWALVVMGLLSGLAFFMLGEGAKRIPAPEVTLMMLLEPTIGPVWALLVLGEKPTTSAIIGGIIVISSLMIHSFLALSEDHPS